MTTERAVELSLPILPYHRKCAYEMAKLMAKRRRLLQYIEARKLGNAVVSPMLLSVDLESVWRMVNN